MPLQSGLIRWRQRDAADYLDDDDTPEDDEDDPLGLYE